MDDSRQAFEKEKEGPIKLNVGGVHYQTTLSNLSKFQSILSVIFSGSFVIELDESGAVFIDRDGTVFYFSLSFL